MTQFDLEQEKKAISVDIDDVLAKRVLARYLGTLNSLCHPYQLPNTVLENIPRLFRDVSENRIQNPKEKVSLAAHAGRPVFPKVRAFLLGKKEEGYSIYGNTGRANQVDWVLMTENFFRENGLTALIEETFYTPKGITTAESKADALRSIQEEGYSELHHYDDDPRTIAFLAQLFPDIFLHLVTHPGNEVLYPEERLHQKEHVIFERNFTE